MRTSATEQMLGRYHAREVTLAQLQRRRLEAGAALKSAKDELKKIKAEPPGEDATDGDRSRWYARLGEQGLKIERLTAEKSAAEAALNHHIGSKALPLFDAAPEVVAADCISGGITLLLEQGRERDDILEMFECELSVCWHRFEHDAKVEQRNEDDDQRVLFDEPLPRDEIERSLAYLLGTSLPAPGEFIWIEVASQLDDNELAAAWAWALRPHALEQPECIAKAVAGDTDRFEHDPRLPCTFTAKAETKLHTGLSAVEVDEEGRVVAFTTDGATPTQVGKLEGVLKRIPVTASLRLLAEFMKRWTTTRDGWTWKGREAPRGDAVAANEPAPEAGAEVEETEEAEAGGLDDIPVEKIRAALEKHKGVQTRAARELDISRDALRRRMEHHGIGFEEYRS